MDARCEACGASQEWQQLDQFWSHEFGSVARRDSRRRQLWESPEILQDENPFGHRSKEELSLGDHTQRQVMSGALGQGIQHFVAPYGLFAWFDFFSY